MPRSPMTVDLPGLFARVFGPKVDTSTVIGSIIYRGFQRMSREEIIALESCFPEAKPVVVAPAVSEPAGTIAPPVVPPPEGGGVGLLGA